MAKARIIDGERVTADRIAAALVDRLIAQERRVAALEKLVDQNFQTWAESLPKLTPDGKLIFRGVLYDQSESDATSTVTVPATVQGDD